MFRKRHKHGHSHGSHDDGLHAPPGAYIATINVQIDGETVEVIQAQDRLAALLLSEPSFVEITDMDPLPTVGWTYDGTTFKPEL